MELKSTLSQKRSDGLRLMETVVIDGEDYNFGTVQMICSHLEGSLPGETTRIENNVHLRSMLLSKKVLAPTEAYPTTHSWCRFYRAEGLEAFYKELVEAQDRLQERESLANRGGNPYLSWLDGESWGLDPAPDALGENDFSAFQINGDEETGTVCLWIEGGDEPYPIGMNCDVAEEAGRRLYALITQLVQNKAAEGGEPFAVQSDAETICFGADAAGEKILVSSDEWGEGNGFELSVAQAESASWQLRELGALVRRKRASAS